MQMRGKGGESFSVPDRSEGEAMACLLVSGAAKSLEKLPEQIGEGNRTPDLQVMLGDERVLRAEVTQLTHSAANSMFSSFRGPPKPDKKLSCKWVLHFSDPTVSDPDRLKPERLDLPKVSDILAGSENEHPGNPTAMAELANRLLGELMDHEVVDRMRREDPELTLPDNSLLLRRFAGAYRGEARKLKVTGAPEFVGPGEGSVKLHASTSYPMSYGEHLGSAQKPIDHKDNRDQGADWLIVVLNPATTASEQLIEDCRRAEHSPMLGQPTVQLDRRGFEEVWVVAMDDVGYSVLQLSANGNQWERFPYFGRHASLQNLLVANPEGTLRRLMALPDHNQARQSDLMRHEAMNALSGVIQDNPDAGLTIVDILIAEPRAGSPKPTQELVEVVLSEWADENTELEGDIIEQISGRLDGIWDWCAGDAELARRPAVFGSGVTWLELACNHWAGHIARIAVRLVSLERQDAGQSWPGLTDRWKLLLGKMIEGDGDPSTMAQATLARSPVTLFHAAYPGWWQDNLLPLFDLDADEGRALLCWDAQLGSGGLPTTEMLDAGMLDCYLKVVRVAQKLDHYSRWNLYRCLAVITLQPGLAPNSWTGGLDAALEDAGPTTRVEWAQSVGDLLAELGPAEADIRWDGLRAYWEARLKSTSAPMDPAEETEVACWAFCFSDRAKEAVDLAMRQPACAIDDESQLAIVLTRTGVWPEKEDLPSCPPVQAARLLAHMFANCPTLSSPETMGIKQHLDFTVTSLLDRLGDHPQANALREQAVRLDVRIGRYP